MYQFIYPSKDAWISELTSSENYGHDEILELKKTFNNTASSSFVYGVDRVLIQFDVTEISKSVAHGLISSSLHPGQTPKYYLKMYSTEASSLNSTYTLTAFPLSSSWEEGTGKKNDDPNMQDGITWERRNQKDAGTVWDISSNKLSSGSRCEASGSETNGSGSQGGGAWLTGSNPTHLGAAAYSLKASQTFSYQSPDIEMDITQIVNKWITGSTGNGVDNNGMIIMRSGSMSPVGGENDSSRQDLKFFSRHTHTIYPPKLEVRWDDHEPCSGSNTGSLGQTVLNMSGSTDNYVYVKGIRPQYREDEIVKFRVGARQRHIGRTFSRSVQTISGSYIDEKSGSYSIVDLATGESIIPFKDIDDNVYTYLSLDEKGNYFKQDMNTFQPNRIYKILIKVNYKDGQEIIYDDDSFQFKVVS